MNSRPPAADVTAPFLRRTLVLIPALNEAESLPSTIGAWKGLGAHTVRVVDNGSTDGTAGVATACGAEVLVEPIRGYGAAAWCGLQRLPPQIEWVLFSSADGSDRLTPPELTQWQQAVDQQADLVLGDRFGPPTSRRHLKPIQTLGNRLCCALIRWGWGRRFNDVGSLRLVRRSCFDRLALRDRGFGWNVEMQVRALERGLRVRELPVGYYPRQIGESKISGNLLGTVRAGFGILKHFAWLWWTKDGSFPVGCET